MPVILRGVIGKVTWSYYDAALLEGYSVSVSKENGRQKWAMSGRIAQSDKFKMAQKPLMFVAPHKQGQWRWPITDLEIREGSITATLGAPLP